MSYDYDRRVIAAIVRPPRFLDTTAMAQRLDRFDFVLEFTAWRTRDRKGRAMSGGIQVQKLSTGGWRVGQPDVGDGGAWQDYRDARMAFEHLRRTGAGFYTTEAENLRADILMGSGNKTASDRIWIEKGKLMVMKDAVTLARALMTYSDCNISEALEYQLYDEKGAPVHESYRGPGQVVKRGTKSAVILGDPYRTATLLEYAMDDNPTRESDKRLDDVIAGVKAAIGDFKPERRMKSKGHDWLRGYDEAMAHRKNVTPK